jgi:hypothetical protein
MKNMNTNQSLKNLNDIYVWRITKTGSVYSISSLDKSYDSVTECAGALITNIDKLGLAESEISNLKGLAERGALEDYLQSTSFKKTASEYKTLLANKNSEARETIFEYLVELGQDFPVRWGHKDTSKILYYIHKVETQTVTPFFLTKIKFHDFLMSIPELKTQILMIQEFLKEELGQYHNQVKTSSISDHVEEFILDSCHANGYYIEDEVVSFTSEPKIWNYNRIDFKCKALEKAEYPAWEEFLERVDFPLIFMAWVGALLTPTDKIRQALILRGEGYDGKSVVIKALQWILSGEKGSTRGSVSVNEKMLEKSFIYSSVYGNHLVTLGDCKNPNFLESEFIHSVTGGDAVPVEAKGVDSFTSHIYTKVIVATNDPLKINTSRTNEITRAITLEVTRKKNIMDDFVVSDDAYEILSQATGNKQSSRRWEDQLWEEAPAFVQKCLEIYKSVNIGKDFLPLPKSLVEKMKFDCMSSTDQVQNDFIEKYLEYDADYGITPTELNLVYSSFHKDETGAKESTTCIRDLNIKIQEINPDIKMKSQVSITEPTEKRIRIHRGVRLKKSTLVNYGHNKTKQIVPRTINEYRIGKKLT